MEKFYLIKRLSDKKYFWNGIENNEWYDEVWIENFKNATFFITKDYAEEEIEKIKMPGEFYVIKKIYC